MKTIERNKQVFEILNKTKLIDLNILGFLSYNDDAKIITAGDLTDGFAVANGNGEIFIPVCSDSFLNDLLDYLPKGFAKFGGVERARAYRIMDMVKARPGYEVLWTSPCSTFVFNPPFNKVDTRGFELGSLNKEDAVECNSYYTYKSEESLNRITENIVKRPTACIRVDGVLACWCMVHNEGSMGIMYVKDEYKGKGIGRIASEHLAEQLLNAGQIPFVQVVEGNVNSFKMVGKMEWLKYSHSCDWFGVERK